MLIQIQPKLLKVLEDKRFRRLGDAETASDVRVIAATHQDLGSWCAKKFRDDLYFRVQRYARIPPLRTCRGYSPVANTFGKSCTD